MQMLRPFKPLRGGYFLHDESFDAGHRDFRPLPGGTPRRLMVPLAHGGEPPAHPVVHAGQALSASQLLAVDDAGAGVHAPLGGVVRAVGAVATPYAAEVPAIEIETAAAGEDRPAELFEGQLAVTPTDAVEFVRAMRTAGADVAALAPFVDAPQPRTLIICGLDTTPPLTCRTQMLFRYGAIVIEAAALVHRLFGIYRTYLAVERGHRTLVRLCARRSRGTPVRVADLVNRYPQADPRMLVRTILGRALPPGGAPGDAGAVVMDIADLVDYARALRGEALTHRLIGITGAGVREPGNYRVPLGAAVGDVLRAVGVPAAPRIVCDCLLSGPAAGARAVVTRRTTAIVALPPPVETAAAPCIRCGLCQDVCPVELDPLAFYRWTQRGVTRDPSRLHPQACIGCGLCDYICPAEIPLMASVNVHRNPQP